MLLAVFLKNPNQENFENVVAHFLGVRPFKNRHKIKVSLYIASEFVHFWSWGKIPLTNDTNLKQDETPEGSRSLINNHQPANHVTVPAYAENNCYTAVDLVIVLWTNDV